MIKATASRRRDSTTIHQHQYPHGNSKFEQVDEMIKISISDNGSGFDLSKPTYGTGLSGMKTRAEEANAHYSLSSTSGQGTSIELTISKK